MEYGGSKPKKIDWMKQYFKSEQPPVGIVKQAKASGWLQKAAEDKDDSDIEWKDFKAGKPGLDSLWDSLPDDDEEEYVPESPKYNPHGPGDLGGAAPMQQGMMMQGPQLPTPEDFSYSIENARGKLQHGYTTKQKRDFINDLNTRVDTEDAVALGGRVSHDSLNTTYSTLYGLWQAKQQQQQQEQGFFGMQPPLQGQQPGMPIHPMMQQSASSSNQGASKQGSSKDGSSKEDVPVIPINLPGINEPFNPPPTSTAVMEAGASNDEKTRRVFAELRVGMKAMSNQQSSAEILNSRRKLMADITSYGTPQRYFEAANSVFLCLTGRTKPADGQVTALQIEGPQGPMDLIGPNGPTQAGFTTYVVSQGENFTTPPIENYGCYPMLANDLLGPVEQRPGSINAIELVGDAKKRYIIQLPMSHEGGGNTPNNPMRETRLNVCFFMNPTELQNLMDEGLFHHLEYYSDNFMPSFNYRYQQLRAQANGFKQQVLAMMKAITETFTSVPSFTADAQVKAGNPDAMYLYMGFKFYVTKIMELTNELTELNNKMAENSENEQVFNSLKPSQEALYKKLVDLIYEMDVWNFIIQTVPDGKLATDVGYWNFSAFGISRAPRLGAGDEILASYKNRTKPWSCYPRCLYQTFHQLQQVEEILEYTKQDLDQAVDAAVSQFNRSNPSALDLIRFGNTQSVLRYAFANRVEIKKLDPDAKLKMLDETQAIKGKTVREAMEAQNASNSNLKTFIARAAGMNPQTFLQLTGQEKSAIRAQRYIAELQNQRRNTIPAFNVNDIVELPQVEQQKQLESTVNKKQFHSTMSVAAQASNPRIVIVNINLEGEHIMYTYRRIDSQNRVISDGQGDKQIQELILLGSKKNVAIANTNLVKRAVQVSSSSQSTAGLTVQDAARILGRQHFRQSDLSVDYEVAFYNSKLQELSQKELFDSNGPTEFARRADGVTLMMSEQLREQQRQMQEIKNLIKNHAQVAALTKQQAKEYWSDPSWQQEYYYQKYQLYRKKFNALQKSWNILASLDAIERAPNGDRPPLDTWAQVTVGQIKGQVSDHGPLSIPIRVINTGWCLRAFDFASRGLPASLANMAQQLRTRVFGSTQTLAETWNNGRILSFGEWATRDEELSNREQTQAARGGKLLTDYDQSWYDEYVMRKEEEKQRVMEEQRRQELEQRQQRLQESRDQQEQLRGQKRDGAAVGDDFLPDGRRKNDDGDGNSDDENKDDDEMDVGHGGGNRKKKTRKRKKKTKRRRKKMKGGKKTKNKRKKKNKSKTRRKTGGEDGPQVTVHPNEGKVKSNKKIVTEADDEKMLRILKLV
uniref:Uncharacterized protein n=1 Tax=viral metagenome TaxID=1070528 RepID=A0A6C0KF11_9ZZZZ